MTSRSLRTISTVAGREVSVALRTKGIIFSLLIAVVLLGAGPFLASWFMDKDSDTPELVTYGVSIDASTAQGLSGAQGTGEGSGKGSAQTDGHDTGQPGLRITEATSAEDARHRVTDGADAALVATDSGYEFLSDGAPNPQMYSQAQALVAGLNQAVALEKLTISPEEYARALPSAEVTTVDVSEGASEVDYGKIVSLLLGSGVIAYFILLFAANIGGRVTEEKSSRVVEIVLASTRPMDFLVGKLIGNFLIGVACSVVAVGVGAVSFTLSGLDESIALDPSSYPIFIAMFVMGYLFFGALYAGAGALVSRTEDLQSTQMPIMLLFMVCVYVPTFGFTQLDSTVMQVLTWIPPVSLVTAPLQYVAGNIGLVELVASYGLMLLTLFLVLAVSSRVYRNAILHNGERMKWLQALTAKG